MYNLANMKNAITVSETFKNETVTNLDFSVMGVYSFAFKSLGLGKLISTFCWAIEYHDEYAGKVHFLSPPHKKTIDREKHVVLLYAPGLLFKEDTSKSKTPLQETHISFKGGELCGLLRFMDSERKYCLFLDREDNLGHIMEKAAFLCSRHGPSSFWEVQALFCRLVSVLINYSIKISENTYEIIIDDKPGISFIEDVETYIRQNISQTIKNSELAGYMNLSESAFNHKFKEKTGVSPKARVIEIKMDAVKGLLLKGKHLKEIAEFTGFYDEFHLSKIFKKKTGLTPIEFRSANK